MKKKLIKSLVNFHVMSEWKEEKEEEEEEVCVQYQGDFLFFIAINFFITHSPVLSLRGWGLFYFNFQ